LAHSSLAAGTLADLARPGRRRHLGG